MTKYTRRQRFWQAVARFSLKRGGRTGSASVTINIAADKFDPAVLRRELARAEGLAKVSRD